MELFVCSHFCNFLFIRYRFFYPLISHRFTAIHISAGTSVIKLLPLPFSVIPAHVSKIIRQCKTDISSSPPALARLPETDAGSDRLPLAGSKNITGIDAYAEFTVEEGAAQSGIQ